jgi:molybdenum cofactor biosynthesis enzyme
MLAPERVAQMAKEIQMSLLERMHKTKKQAAEQPHELIEIDARTARMRKRMAAGDPDITPDELRAALDRAEYKRRELAHAKPAGISEGAKLLTILPNAAELYRRQIALGLDGAHSQIMLKARLAIRELLGQIRLEPVKTGACGRPTKCISPWPASYDIKAHQGVRSPDHSSRPTMQAESYR